MVAVAGGSRGWVSVAGVVCVRPGHRTHLFYRLRVWRGRTGERRSFAWWEYRDLIVGGSPAARRPGGVGVGQPEWSSDR